MRVALPLRAKAAAVGMLLGFAGSASLASAAGRSLTADAAVETLPRGKKHTYSLRLDAGRFARVGFDQIAGAIQINARATPAPAPPVAIRIEAGRDFGPDDDLLLLGGRHGRGYLIELLAAGPRAAKYRARLAEQRPEVSADAERVNANHALFEARSLARHEDESSFSRAQTLCDSALATVERLGDRRLILDALRLRGRLRENTGARQDALADLRAALAVARELGDRWSEATTLTQIGWVLHDLGEPHEALDQARHALGLFGALGDERGIGKTLNVMGILHDDLGNKRQALSCYQDALAAARAVGDPMGQAVLHNNVGALFGVIGDHRRARSHYAEAAALFGRLQLNGSQGTVIANIGQGWTAEGRPDRAIRHLNEALVLARRAGDDLLEGSTESHLGAALLLSGRTQEARAHLERALQLLRKAGGRRDMSETLVIFGRAHEAGGEWKKAQARFAEGLALARDIDYPAIEAAALAGEARVHLRESRLDEAHAAVERAVRVVESIRGRLAFQDLRTTYLASVFDVYALQVEILMRRHARDPSGTHAVEALAAAERGRARSLLDTLQRAGADLREGVPSDLLAEEWKLRRRLRAPAGERLATAERTTGPAEAAALQARYEQVAAALQQSPSHFAPLAEAPPNVIEFQEQTIDEDTTLLEYALGREAGYVWVVDRRSMAVFPLEPGPRIDEAARAYLRLVTERGRFVPGETPAARKSRIARADARLAAAASKLSALVLAPMATRLRGQRLLVVADGVLNAVPFAALPLPGRAAPTPVITEHEVVYAPSAAAVALLRRRPATTASSNRVGVFADPVFAASDPRVRSSGGSGSRGARVQQARWPRLPFTRAEAQAIRQVAPDRVVMALGFAANRTALLGPEAAQFRIVHFATHAVLAAEQPAESGVVLSLVDEKGRAQPGFLSMNDVFHMNLPVDLVVLSACEGALGRPMRGEGLVGVARGFLHAGARRVLAGLWRVDDRATAELMRAFYAGLLGARTLSPPAALREAQRTLAADPRWSHPYYWAAFGVQGDWR